MSSWQKANILRGGPPFRVRQTFASRPKPSHHRIDGYLDEVSV
jgi:hypothetical protein